jgi:hypothetical protein
MEPRKIVILLLNNLKQNTRFLPVVNDHTRIDSFADYIFSRYCEKLTLIAANYVRLDWMIDTLNFEEIKAIQSDNPEQLKTESELEMVAAILRPLTEIYLEIKSIEYTVTKFDLDLESCCQMLYYDSVSELFNLKLSISRDIYNCEPKYFKQWSDISSKEINEIKQKLSAANIPILKNIKNKYRTILENFGNTERLILGYDYLTHYATLSKRTHFSYTNVLPSMSPKHYLHWCLAYYLMIYESTMKLLHRSDQLYEEIKPIVSVFMEKSAKAEMMNYKIGDYVFMDFGVAIVKDIKLLTYEIEYVVSNCFNTGETDAIPRIFITGNVEKTFLEITTRKYYPTDKEIYQDDNFEPFYMEIMQHCKENKEKG